MIEVSRLYVYPVKSCRGISVDRMPIDRRGPAGDRRFMIVSDTDKFLTQRDDPRLSLVRVAIDPDREALRLDAPEMPALEIPRAPTEGPRREVVVWRSRCEAIEVASGSEWLSSYMGRAVRLVYMPDDVERGVNPDRGAPGDTLSFADGYPFLLVSEESLDELVRRAGVPLEMERFRPNVVVRGSTPHGEDDFRSVRIGAVTFRGVKRCDRCTVTTVDPRTGERGLEPLATLATYRKEDGAVWFGMNLVHDSVGEIRLGDQVEVG